MNAIIFDIEIKDGAIFAKNFRAGRYEGKSYVNDKIGKLNIDDIKGLTLSSGTICIDIDYNLELTEEVGNESS